MIGHAPEKTKEIALTDVHDMAMSRELENCILCVYSLAELSRAMEFAKLPERLFKGLRAPTFYGVPVIEDHSVLCGTFQVRRLSGAVAIGEVPDGF
jgi:hypothetical protein